jgi:hypothetical protein
MTLEQEELAGLEGAKGVAAARLPEVRLVRPSRRERLKPILVGDGDEEPNHGPRLAGSCAAGKVVSYSRLQS